MHSLRNPASVSYVSQPVQQPQAQNVPVSAPEIRGSAPSSVTNVPPSNVQVSSSHGLVSEAAIAEWDAKVKMVFSEHVGGSVLEIIFSDMMVPPTAEMVAQRRMAAVNELVTIFRTVSPELVEPIFRLVLKHRPESESAHALVKDTVEIILQTQILPLKNVCESLLTASECSIDFPVIWLETFEFLDSHIPKLDYKGVRDVLKVLLERIQTIPVHLRPDQRTLVEAAENLVSKTCDRKNNFLPAYFVENEIRKNHPDFRCFPHWRLAKVCTDVIDSFRPLAQLVSIVGRSQMVPVAGHVGLHLNTSWKMDSTVLKFPFKGVLPYSTETSGPQHYLIYQALMQGGYRELLTTILVFPKTEKLRCQMLEDIVVSMILEVMAEGEREGRQFRIIWRTLAGLIVYMTIGQMISFPRLVIILQQKLTILPYRKSRDQLMWCLLQYVSGGMQKSVPEEFNCLLDLYRVLYSGTDKFTVSNADSSITFALAAACIWMHMTQRTQRKGQNAGGPDLDIPPSINSQIQFLQENLKQKQLSDSYMFAVLCNAYSTTTEIFQQELMPVLIESLDLSRSGATPPPNSSISLPGGLLAENRTAPLKYEFLDAVTVHVRMHQNFAAYIQRKSTLALSPACVETYGRLLSYVDSEPQGLKLFLQMPHIASRSNCLEAIYAAIEILVHRLYQLPLSHRVQAVVLVQQLYANAVVSANYQLYCILDNALIRLLFWCPPSEILQPMYNRFLTIAVSNSQDTNKLVDNEEVAKVIVLSLARSLIIAGADSASEYKDIISRFRAHSWHSSMFRLFPAGFDLIYGGQAPPIPVKQRENILQQQVREEIIKWRTLGNEASLIEHFTRSQHQVYLCLLYHLLGEVSELQPVAIKILEALGPRTIFSQLQTFIDYLIIECGRRQADSCADIVNKMIWKYGIFQLDRFILTAVLRHYEGNDAVLALLLTLVIIQRSPDQLHARITECISLLPADHWHCQDWHEKHMTYHQKYPDRHWATILQEMTRSTQSGSIMPVYFSNVCFAILPALDLLILRLLDAGSQLLQRFFDSLMAIIGPLYRYHPHPVMFLYTTYRFFEKKFSEITIYRQKLLLHIHNAHCISRGETWLVSSDYLHYLQQQQHQQSDSVVPWVPDLDYFAQLLRRLVDCLAQPLLNPQWIKIDWRFSEFPGSQTHALYAVCVELMALPNAPSDVGLSLVNVVIQGHQSMARRDLMKWTNALGLIFTALPLSYLQALYDALTNALRSEELANWTNVFAKANVEHQLYVHEDSSAARLLAIAHAVWQHATIGYMTTLPQVVRERWRPFVTTEVQFFYVCQLVCPFMLRLYQERSKQAMEVATDIYEMLLCVDKNIPEWKYEDIVCDLLYHMKYQYVGQGIRPETDRVIPLLRPSLQEKLRYINQQLDTVMAMELESSLASFSSGSGTADPPSDAVPPVPPRRNVYPNGDPTFATPPSPQLSQEKGKEETIRLTRRAFSSKMDELRKHGWYWGPITWQEAEYLLHDQAIGSFLVRDSTDDKHIFSLSFKTQSGIHHTRINQHGDEFFFGSRNSLLSSKTIVGLIGNALRCSADGSLRFLVHPAIGEFPVDTISLLQPVSRFTVVPSLKHMARFEILKYIPTRDKVDHLPLPEALKVYLRDPKYIVEL